MMKTNFKRSLRPCLIVYSLQKDVQLYIGLRHVSVFSLPLQRTGIFASNSLNDNLESKF